MNMSNLRKSGIIIASLCAASSVLAASPTTGTTTFSGKLTGNTCTVNTQTTYVVPNLTVQQINAIGANGTVKTLYGRITLTSCTGVKPTMKLLNSAGDGYNKGSDQTKGLFKYDNTPTGAGPEKGPLMFGVWLSNGKAYPPVNLNGTSNYTLFNNQDYQIEVYRKGSNSAEGYQGGFRTNVTMNVTYN